MMRWMLRPVAAVMLAALALAGGPERADAKPERPEFVVVSTEDKFEIRDYATLVVAQFTMRGSYKRSVSQGYMRLEEYFLGKNTVPEAMKMTVPTMVRDDLASGWTTIFVLPRGYRAETAPRPVDRRIRVVEFPPRRVAVIEFPGKLNELVMREQIARLDAWLAAKGIAHRGDFTLAGYDPPWTPAAWRDNEVLVTLK
ncbi:MAG: heme-binding protein [Proteobacteria bacterium]|nr:heme-binding protein [Pseudomonadota bacterium]